MSWQHLSQGLCQECHRNPHLVVYYAVTWVFSYMMSMVTHEDITHIDMDCISNIYGTHPIMTDFAARVTFEIMELIEVPVSP